MDIASASYIGRKGYTILKSSLNEQEYKKIKTELYLKPVISGQNYGMVKVNPSSSGTIEPNKIPIIVVNCQTIHNVIPEPNK